MSGEVLLTHDESPGGADLRAFFAAGAALGLLTGEPFILYNKAAVRTPPQLWPAMRRNGHEDTAVE